MRGTSAIGLRGRILLCAAALALITGPARVRGDDDYPFSVQAIVRLQRGSDIDQFNGKYGTRTLRSVSSWDIYLLQLPVKEGEEDGLVERMRNDSVCRYAERNYFGDAPEATGREFFFNINKNRATFAQQDAWSQINLAPAQQLSLGAGTVVALLDTGVDAAHPDLDGRILDTGYNFLALNSDTSDVGDGIDNDGDGVIDGITGHGTFMAGLITYVAPEAMLLPIKVLDDEGRLFIAGDPDQGIPDIGGDFLLMQGIYYAIDAGADVISISIGSTYMSDGVEEAIADAADLGIVVVAAAGNLDAPIPEYPAGFEGALGVASVDDQDIKSAFSNYGTPLAVSGPGNEVYSTLPGEQYGAWDGTSMPTPMVAGVAALLLSQHPEWPRNQSRPGQVRAYLAQGAFDLDLLNPDYEGLLGAGRLDAGAALSSGIVFDEADEYDVGTRPEDVAAADFDGDGFADLAVSNAGGGDVSVLFNRLDEESFRRVFGDPAAYDVGSEPRAIVAADYSGDGRLDLATANAGSDSVSILKNQGDGTFAAAVNIGVRAAPVDLAAGDWDGDDDVDLAAACQDDDVVAILKNDGSGKFTVSANVDVGSEPAALAAADLDGDGDLDLVTADEKSATLTVLRNSGGGTFSAFKTISVGDRPRDVAAGDLDSDGDVDLVVANHGHSDLGRDVWTLMNGGGNFTVGQKLVMNGERRPDRLLVVDLNCDGALELLVTSNPDSGEGFVSVFANDGGGRFTAPFEFTLGTNPAGMAAADLDHDADADVAVANQSGDNVAVLINQTCAAPLAGDANCDGDVNFDDIDPFVLALTGGESYAEQFPDCNYYNADVNRDGSVDFADIDGFVECLVQGGCP